MSVRRKTRTFHPPMHWSDVSEWIAAPQQKRSQRALYAVLDAGAKLFGRDGFEATTIAGIAAEAGVSVASIYRRFADKKAIFRAIVDLWSRSWTADLDRMWGSIDWSTRTRAEIILFHVDLAFSAYRADPGLLVEIHRRSGIDDESCAILAGMERHAATSLYKHLRARDGSDPGGELRTKADITVWMLQATVAGLVVRKKQGNWPDLSLENEGLEESLTSMLMALFGESTTSQGNQPAGNSKRPTGAPRPANRIEPQRSLGRRSGSPKSGLAKRPLS